MNKLILKVFGGLLGLVLGAIIGGFLGLVAGGTFLGGFNIYEQIGIEGYELATYIGAIVGALAGIIIALGIVKRKNV